MFYRIRNLGAFVCIVWFSSLSSVIAQGNWIDEGTVNRNLVEPVPKCSKYRWVQDFHLPNQKVEEGFLNRKIHIVDYDGKPVSGAFLKIYKRQMDHLNPKSKDQFKFVGEFEAGEDGVTELALWVGEFSELLLIARSKDGRQKFTKRIFATWLFQRSAISLRLLPTICFEFFLLDDETGKAVVGAKCQLIPSGYGKINDLYPELVTDKFGYVRVKNWDISHSCLVYATHPNYHNFDKSVVSVGCGGIRNQLRNSPKFNPKKNGGIPEEGFEAAEIIPSLKWDFLMVSNESYERKMKEASQDFELQWKAINPQTVKQKSAFLYRTYSRYVGKVKNLRQSILTFNQRSLGPVALEIAKHKVLLNLVCKKWEELATRAKSEEDRYYYFDRAWKVSKLDYGQFDWALDMVQKEFFKRQHDRNRLLSIRSYVPDAHKVLSKIADQSPYESTRIDALMEKYYGYGGALLSRHDQPANSFSFKDVSATLAAQMEVYEKLINEYGECQLPKRFGRSQTVKESLVSQQKELSLLQIGSEFPDVIRYTGKDRSGKSDKLFTQEEVEVNKGVVTVVHFHTCLPLESLTELKALRKKYQSKVQVISIAIQGGTITEDLQKKMPWPVFMENFRERGVVSIAGEKFIPPVVYWGKFPVHRFAKFKTIVLTPERKLFAIGSMQGELEQLVVKAMKE